MKTPHLRPIVRCTLAAVLLAGALVLSPGHGADAKPPKQISYQGYVTDANAVPLGNTAPANYTVNFRIYTVSTGGTALWAEQQTVTIDKGYFSVLLGEGSAIGTEARPDLDTLFGAADASERYIGMTVTGLTTTEIAPRMRLLTTPYAFLAKNAANVVNAAGTSVLSATTTGMTISTPLTISGNLTATTFAGNLDASYINAGTLNVNRIPSLDAAKITTGAFATDRIPNHDASKITTGAFLTNRIPALNASHIVGGTLDTAEIPALDAAKITTGAFAVALIPNLDTAKITTGTLNDARLSANVARRDLANTFSAANTFSGAVTVSGALTVNNNIAAVNAVRARGGVPGGYGVNNNGYAFNSPGDNDSGLFSTGDGVAALYANSAERVRAAADGVFLFNIPKADHGNMQWDGGTGKVTYDSSSRQDKENIRPLEDDFSRLLEAQPMTYTRPGNPDRWEIGYIAEDFSDLGLCRLLYYDAEGLPSGVNYNKISLYLTEIARQQRAEISALKDEQATQQKVIGQLQNRLDALERQLRLLASPATPAQPSGAARAATPVQP